MPGIRVMEVWDRKDAKILLISFGLILSIMAALFAYFQPPPSYRVVFNIQSNKNMEGRYVQIFYDLGRGYNEHDTAVWRLSEKNGQLKTIDFAIPTGAHGKIRLDPIDKGVGQLTLSDMRIVDPSGHEAAWVDMRKLTPTGKGISLQASARNLDLNIDASNNDPIMLADWDSAIWAHAPSGGGVSALKRFFVVIASYIGLLALAAAALQGSSRLARSDRVVIGTFAKLCVAGFVVLVARSPDAVLSPMLYTEDGVWLSSLMIRGFWVTMTDARPDYLVWGNILLLQLARFLNWVLNGDSVKHLPLFVASVSYLFYAALFSLTYLAFRPVLGRWVSVLMWLLLLLVPLGNTANEVYGRLSNIGYSIPILVLSLYILRGRMLLRGFSTMAKCVDIIFLVCACTNPLAIPMVGFVWVVEWIWVRRDIGWKGVFWLALMLALLSVLTAFTAYRIHYFGTKVLGEGVIFENFIPAFIGRMFEYPVLFPFYGYLNDKLVVLLIVVGLGGYLSAVVLARSELRRLLLMSGVVLLGCSLSTVVMRPGITHIITDYAQTFPDRYYFGQSLLMLIVVCLSICAFARGGYPKLSLIGASMLCSVYLVGLPSLMEWGQPRLVLMTGLNYKDQVARSWHDCQADAACRTTRANITVPTYFEGWSMVLPRKSAEATVNDLE